MNRKSIVIGLACICLIILGGASADEIVRARLKAGAARLTFNPEFGPPTYMPTLPDTRQPVSDLWEICLWMAKRFEARYSTLVP